MVIQQRKSIIILSLFLLAAFFIAGCIAVETPSTTVEFGEFDAQEAVEEKPSPFFAPQEEGSCANGEEDFDDDGVCNGRALDCDDTDPNINPHAQEQCDGVDNDCDDKVDEGCSACQDECVPEGQYCAAGTSELKRCVNTDSDPCLELLRVECTYGCDGGSCKDAAGTPLEDKYIFARPGERPPASDAWRTSITEISNESCSGSFIGSIEWNEKGSLCRRERFDDPGAGFITPISCCSRYYRTAVCVKDMGEVSYQSPAITYKYHEIGCYATPVDPAVS